MWRPPEKIDLKICIRKGLGRICDYNKFKVSKKYSVRKNSKIWQNVIYPVTKDAGRAGRRLCEMCGHQGCTKRERTIIMDWKKKLLK